MDYSCKKMYSLHEVDAKNLYELYFSAHTSYSVFKESTINLIRALYKCVCTGIVTGRTMIDFSFGPIITHLLLMKDCMQEITVIKFNDASLRELEKWKNKDPDAFNWSYIVEILMELKGSSDGSKDEEENLREKINYFLKWDLCDDGPANLLSLPKADLVTCMWALEMISKDHDDYRRNLRKICNFVKPGGYFLQYAAINASYFNIGEDSFHHLPCDDNFFKKLLCEEGFEIKHCEKFDRVMCTDSVDHEGIAFIIAQKLKRL